MTDLQQRLKELMAEYQLKTMQELADFAGVSKGLVGQWFSGVTGLGKKPLLNLTQKTRYSAQWLADGSGEKYQQPKQEQSAVIVGGMETWDSDTPINDDEVELPFFKEVELAAGSGRTVLDDVGGYKLRFAKSSLKKAGVQPENARCVTVIGNSMEPVLPEGSTVGIDTANKEIKDGKVYAIDHDGALRIKILYKLPNGGLRLRSYNRDEWEDEDILPTQMQFVRIIGRLFWSSTMWD